MGDAPPSLARLETYSPTLSWLQVSHRLIELATPNNNNLSFLSLFKALPTSVQTDYEDLLASTANDTYAQLRERLRQRLAVPSHVKFDAIYARDPLGDRSPSAYLRDIRKKFRDAEIDNEEQLRYAFIQGLPNSYGNMVLSRPNDGLEEIATTIDALWHLNKTKTSQINSTKPASPSNEQHPLSSAIRDLTKDLYNLNKRLDRIESDQASTPKQFSARHYSDRQHYTERQSHPDHSRNYNRNLPSKHYDARNEYHDGKANGRGCPRAPTTNDRRGLCYAHARFGASARQCKLPCRWRDFKIPPHICSDGRYCPWDKFTQIQDKDLN